MHWNLAQSLNQTLVYDPAHWSIAYLKFDFHNCLWYHDDLLWNTEGPRGPIQYKDAVLPV